MKLKPYSFYTPTVFPWLTPLPSHWQFKRLKHCVSLVNQKTDGAAADLPYTGLEQIESWTGRRLTEPGLMEESEGQSNLHLKGDVLFGKLRPYLAKVLRADSSGICTGELLVLRPSLVDQSFLFYFMLSRDTITLVNSSTYGVKMPRANWDFIGNLPMSIPPLPEQRAIAAFLDRETERIDSLIEKKQKQIELLQKKRVALISQAVTKGLDPKVKMKDSGVEWLGMVPEGWKISKIGWKSRVVRGASPRPAGDPLYFFGDFIPWITVGEITKDEEKYLTGTETMLTRLGMEFSRVMQCNTLVLTNSGATLGVPKIFKISGCANDGVVALLDISNDMIQGYIYFYLVLMTKVYRDRIKQGSGQPNLNTEIIQSTAIPVPPKEEQNAIIAFLDIEINRIDSIKEKIVRSIDKLEQYRTSLISSAVTGKIDVRSEMEIHA